MKKTLATFLLAALIINANAQQIPNSEEILERASKLQEGNKRIEAISLYKQIHPSDSNYYRGLYEIASCYYADSQYNKALEISTLGISTLNDQRPSFYNLLGNILDDMGQQDKAFQYYDSAVRTYPNYLSPYLNIATLLIKQDKLAEAETFLQHAAFIFPFSPSVHYKLGIVALNQGKIIQSFLSMSQCLLTAPDGHNMKNAVTILSSMAKGDDEMLDYYHKRKVEADANYALVEEMFISKIALDPKFKINTDLEDAITRQYQMIIEKLEYNKEDKDFYVQYYLPYLKEIYSTKQYNAYCNYMFSGLGIDQINNFLKKNKKEISAMSESATNYFHKIRVSRELFAHKRSAEGPWHYENGSCFAKGKYENKKTLGYWEFYYLNGNIRSKGNYDANGKQTGEWIYYGDNTRISAKQNYVDGLLQGENIDYHQNGSLARNAGFIKGEKQGENHDYYPSGNLKSIQVFDHGKESGVLKYYNNDGTDQAIINAANGELNGKLTRFYSNGRLESEASYTAGKMNGKYKSWYDNGNMYAEGAYENDKQTGTWKYYHENGKLKSVQQYVSGEIEGEASEFHDNDQLSSKQTYRKGKQDGDVLLYSRDGKIFSKLVYVNGKLKEAYHYDLSGKQISKTETRGKNFDLDVYTPYGTKKSTAKYNDKGISNGEETEYWSSGAIYSKLNYSEGSLSGEAKYFFNNGKIEQEINYSNGGEKNGFYREYYKHGGVFCDGYFVGNQKEGVWNYYDDFGRIRSRTHYSGGDRDGFDETYYRNGMVEFREEYVLGSLVGLTQYDTTGKVLASLNLEKGNGKFETKTLAGTIFASSSMKNGFLHGPYSSFYFDGKPLTKEFYYYGVSDSTYQAFYYSGKIQQEGKYYRGDKIGIWNYYNEDGKIYLREEYVHGKLHGKRVFYHKNENPETETTYFHGRKDGWLSRFSEDGLLVSKIRYSDDIMMEYTYEDKSGQLVAPISIAGGNGKMVTYFRNGNLSSKMTYVDGDLNGDQTYYHSNGKVSFESKEDFNMTEGPATAYYDNGQPKEKYNYLHNDYQGAYQSFYQDGKPRQTGTYFNDLKHGEWISYSKDGKAEEKAVYYYGRLLNLKKL